MMQPPIPHDDSDLDTILDRLACEHLTASTVAAFSGRRFLNLLIIPFVVIGMLLSLTAASTAPPMPGNIAVVPETGPPGTIFALIGVGYPRSQAGGILNISVRPAQAVPTRPTVAGSVEVAIGTNGDFQARYDSAGLAAGRYTVFVWTQNGPDQVIAETTLTITAVTPGQPSLPATGGGGMAVTPRLGHNCPLVARQPPVSFPPAPPDRE